MTIELMFHSLMKKRRALSFTFVHLCVYFIHGVGSWCRWIYNESNKYDIATNDKEAISLSFFLIRNFRAEVGVCGLVERRGGERLI